VFVYIRNLEKTGCECAIDWKSDFILVYICIFLPLACWNAFSPFSYTVGAFIGILTLAFIVIVLLYIHDLKKKKCECSESHIRDVLEIVNYIQIGLLGLVLLVGIYLATVGIDKNML
jgi:hypothetical protein